MPRSEGITTRLRFRPGAVHQGPRKCPDQRGLRRHQAGKVIGKVVESEEMPRSEGITTATGDGSNYYSYIGPRKCPDQRGLRLDDLVRRLACGLCPRKCPDQRGLRRSARVSTEPTGNRSEEMPRSEGITTVLSAVRESEIV